MRSGVLIHTGPLVAFLAENDSEHEWAQEQWRDCTSPFLTCEAVIAETLFLLHRSRVTSSGLLELLHRKIVRMDFSVEEELAATSVLLQRYSSVPMSLADACLVRMSEMHSNATLFTTDRDFLLYRRHGRQSIPLIAPW